MLANVLPKKAAGDGRPLLELKEIKRDFGGVRAVDGVSMIVRRGHIHGLIGPNGSGKSTLVNVISGLYTPSSGTILLKGAPLPAGSLYDAAQKGSREPSKTCRSLRS